MTRVRNNPERKRYELDTELGLAVADYKIATGTVAIYHTHVPVDLRERGIGGELVRGAMDDIRAQGLKVEARCSFVRAFLAANPEYSDLQA